VPAMSERAGRMATDGTLSSLQSECACQIASERRKSVETSRDLRRAIERMRRFLPRL
jgi:hypothetical protein